MEAGVGMTEEIFPPGQSNSGAVSEKPTPSRLITNTDGLVFLLLLL